MVLSGNEDFITFALTTDGTKVGLNARIVTGGVATTVLDDTDYHQYQNPMYLRITKAQSCLRRALLGRWRKLDAGRQLHRCHQFYFHWSVRQQLQQHSCQGKPCSVMSVNWFDVRQ